MKRIKNEKIMAPSGITVIVPPDNRDLTVQVAIEILTSNKGITIESMADAQHAFRLAKIALDDESDFMDIEDADYDWLMEKFESQGPRILGLHAYMTREGLTAEPDNVLK